MDRGEKRILGPDLRRDLRAASNPPPESGGKPGLPESGPRDRVAPVKALDKGIVAVERCGPIIDGSGLE
jgi:hypothetical protein